MKIQFEINKVDGKKVPIQYGEIRFLLRQDINSLIELQNLIVSSLSDPDLFNPDNESFFLRHLGERGHILGCFLTDKLIAYGIMSIPGVEEDNVGYDLDMTSDELNKVVHLDSFAVEPIYRGNHLQVILCKLIERMAREEGFEHLCSTVSPKNEYSLRNLLSVGMEIKKSKQKYGGKQRYILYKHL